MISNVSIIFTYFLKLHTILFALGSIEHRPNQENPMINNCILKTFMI